MSMVRKLENISEVGINVKVDEQTTFFVPAGKTLENVNVTNLNDIRKFIKVTEDLSEVQPVKESRIKLYD